MKKLDDKTEQVLTGVVTMFDQFDYFIKKQGVVFQSEPSRWYERLKKQIDKATKLLNEDSK